MDAIPTPAEAQGLRTLFAGNPVIGQAERALRTFRNDLHVRDAAVLLASWKHAPELSARERLAVLARFVPPPAARCARCHARIRYVTDGPDPGWWTHTDPAGMRGEGARTPHEAAPDYGHGDEGGNAGPGWPLR
ncbi:hypothetical protein ACQP2P_01455 [Dactylosporangium sp. CA-139114]|uniref:hypothetical protein n=1 Tax=Dactylosporangium sp. CA-139114 TaxID=3239931 RepID=UPI003D98DF57